MTELEAFSFRHLGLLLLHWPRHLRSFVTFATPNAANLPLELGQLRRAFPRPRFPFQVTKAAL